MDRVADTVKGTRAMKAVRLVVRICSALVVAFLAASLALAAAGCAVPFVERPAAEVVLVPVA